MTVDEYKNNINNDQNRIKQLIVNNCNSTLSINQINNVELNNHNLEIYAANNIKFVTQSTTPIDKVDIQTFSITLLDLEFSKYIDLSRLYSTIQNNLDDGQYTTDEFQNEINYNLNKIKQLVFDATQINT